MIKPFLKLIEQEKSCLLEGRIAELAKLTTLKRSILRDLDQARLTRAELVCLAREMTRQEALLVACRQGLEKASGRLEELRQVQEGLNHYTKAGTIETIGGRRPGMEKRA